MRPANTPVSPAASPATWVVYVVSDHTGLTAESVARSLLTQFENLELEYVMRPFTTDADISKLHAEITSADRDGLCPIVFSTLADPTLNQRLKSVPGLHLDLLHGHLAQLEVELGLPATGRVGRWHSISDSSYFNRIEAVDFALATDDGLGDRQYQMADVILLGVSRAGKTPTCLFLGLQYGLRAANYPLADDDFEREHLPEPVRQLSGHVFGLTINPVRLHKIRSQRKPGSRYATLEQCEYEVRRAEALFRQAGVRCFDTTSASIEEIASSIAQALKLSRNG